MHVRTTLTIDDDLIGQARSLSGIQAKTGLVHAGLEALIAREAGNFRLMWLVDTSVWIDHFRNREAELVAHLSEGLVLMHPSLSANSPAETSKIEPMLFVDVR
jgi:hypothetical protein